MAGKMGYSKRLVTFWVVSLAFLIAGVALTTITLLPVEETEEFYLRVPAISQGQVTVAQISGWYDGRVTGIFSAIGTPGLHSIGWVIDDGEDNRILSRIDNNISFMDLEIPTSGAYNISYVIIGAFPDQEVILDLHYKVLGTRNHVLRVPGMVAMGLGFLPELVRRVDIRILKVDRKKEGV